MEFSQLRAAGFAIGCVALGACASISDHPAQSDIQKLLPGTWYSEEAGHGTFVSMKKTYFCDGTAKGVLQVRDSSRGVTVHSAPNHFRSRWRISGNLLECYDIRDDQKFFSANVITKDRILSISADKMRIRSLEEGIPVGHRTSVSVRVQ